MRGGAASGGGDAVRIGWCTDPDAAPELARFFVREVTPAYISHGEIIAGRASGLGDWNADLEAVVTAELRTVIQESGDASARTRVLEVYDGAGLAGMAIVSFHRDSQPWYAILEDIVVAGAGRGKGIGSLAVRWLEQRAREQSMAYFFLESGIHNEGAHSFFKRHGFVTSSVVMMKRLEDPQGNDTR